MAAVDRAIAEAHDDTAQRGTHIRVKAAFLVTDVDRGIREAQDSWLGFVGDAAVADAVSVAAWVAGARFVRDRGHGRPSRSIRSAGPLRHLIFIVCSSDGQMRTSWQCDRCARGHCSIKRECYSCSKRQWAAK